MNRREADIQLLLYVHEGAVLFIDQLGLVASVLPFVRLPGGVVLVYDSFGLNSRGLLEIQIVNKANAPSRFK